MSEDKGVVEERLRWFYTPTDHGGLPLGEMRPAQQRLCMRLVSTGLSRAGYVTAATIMGCENVLDQLEAWRASFGHERGRDPARYYLRVYYRVQGHRLLVEYANTTRDANHVHTVWRDPVGDFGMDALGAHRRREH